MKTTFLACLATLACSGFSPLAHAQQLTYYPNSGDAAAFSFSSLAFASTGAGATTLDASIITNSFSSTAPLAPRLISTVGQTSIVAIAPTATTTGLAYDYDINSYVGQVSHATWSENVATITVAADGALAAGDKYIWITGKISAVPDLVVGQLPGAVNGIQIRFNETDNGSYQTTASPLLPGVSSIKGTAAFYFGTDAGAIPSLVSSSTAYATASQSYMSGTANAVTDRFLLTGGSTVDFSALVYATDGASIDKFSLNFHSGSYNFSGGIYDDGPSYTQLQQTGSHVLAAIPEPASYALFLAGLGLLGVTARRRGARA